MSKVIIYNQENGIMAVCVPALNSGLTVEQVADKDCPKGAKIIDRTDLDGLDNTFRNAWTCDEDMKPTINITLAKDIWRNKIRNARKPKLEELDIQYMRAQEAGEDTADIVAKKNKLRDFPAKAEIDSATTVEELKAIWDNDLGDK
tara:strand:- start:200 stop:637 length:438 start_codon:yes stop_codon:yes gene_type:complete